MARSKVMMGGGVGRHRNGSEVKSICCSCRGEDSIRFLAPTLRLTIVYPVLGNPMPSSGLSRQYIQMLPRHRQASIHINFKKKGGGGGNHRRENRIPYIPIADPV